MLLAAFCAGLGLLIAALLGRHDESSPGVSPHALGVVVTMAVVRGF